MKKSKLLVYSLAVLLGTALASCAVGGNSTSSDAPSSEEIVSSEFKGDTSGEVQESVNTDDTRRYNIYFDEELTAQLASGNIELEQGNRFLLWQHVSVPDGTYTLEAVTDNVVIDGHVIYAKDYGPFKVKINAIQNGTGKKTTKAISGNVVSAGKILFNSLWNEASETNNFTASNEYFGTVYHNEKYIEMEWATQGSGTIFRGNVYDEATGRYYTYDYLDSNPGTLEFGKGYGASNELLMTTKDFGIPASSWVEQFDQDGNSLNQFILEDTLDNNGYSDLIDPFMDKLFSMGNGYSVLVNRAGARKLVATVDEDTGTIQMTAARENGSLIKTYASSGKTYNVVTTISDVGLTGHDAVDAWLANPVYPEKVDTSKLKAFFTGIETAKNYTCERVGAWMDRTTGKLIEAPQAVVDSGFAEYLNTYDAIDFVTEDTLVNVVTASTPEVFNYIGQANIKEKWTVPSAGDVTTYFTNESGWSGAIGTVDLESKEMAITYGAPQLISSEVKSLWGLSKSEDGSWMLPLVHEGLADIIDLMSFSDYAAEGGEEIYSFSTTGDDCNPSAEDNRVILYWGDEESPSAVVGGFEGYLSYISVDGLDFNTNVISNILFERTGMEYYYSRNFILGEGSCTLLSALAYDNSLAYVTITEWSDVGTTVLDDATLALTGKTASAE
ncbi:MAG: hypothetical protein SOV58_03120 [Candidatus Enteromonas sp.]|nr:hypothetical protein [Candidatus Enteromonas sp.]